MPAWKRSVIYGVSFILVYVGTIAFDLACGPEPDPYDYYISFFHNSNQPNKDYRSFYFNGWTFLNDDDNPVTEQEVNTREWAAYLGQEVKWRDVGYALYGLSPKSDSVYFRNYASGKNHLPDSLKRNTFLQALTSNRQANALAYCASIKKAEPLITADYSDKWNPIPYDKKPLHAYAINYLQSGIKEEDRFLKLRYFYKAQHYLFYGGFNQEVINIYDKYIANYASNSQVKGWALSLKAGAHYRLGHNAYAAYLFSKVFATCPERRVQAYHDFLSMKAPFNEVIKQTRNNTEKALVYAINGFHTSRVSVDALKQVYSIQPKSNLLSVLLVREINKIEEGYLTPRLNGSAYYGDIGFWNHSAYDSVKQSYISYIPQLKAFCKQLANDRKYTEPALGNLAVAYLSWIQGDTPSGFDALAAIGTEQLSARLNDQRQLINLLLLSQNIKKLDAATEAQLLPSLLWLDKKVKWEAKNKKDSTRYWGDYALKYYSASSRDFYAKVLAPIYLKQKDTAMAALCILRSENTVQSTYNGNYNPGPGYCTPVFWQTALHSYHLKKILKWKSTGGKPVYMNLLMTDVNRKLMDDIYDVLGTAYLREHNYTAAAKTFALMPSNVTIKAPTNVWADEPAYGVDAFSGRLHDYPKPYLPKGKKGYNKITFAKAMARLQREVKAKPQNAAAYYSLANGLYNTSYHGSGWYFISYNWAADDVHRGITYYYDHDYMACRGAERYYLKARQLTNDVEFKARCTFMAAKCRQKQFFYPDWPSWTDNEKEYKRLEKIYDRQKVIYNNKIISNNYFNDLKRNYAQTRFYKTAISECSYLRDFLALAPEKKTLQKGRR